MEDSEKLMALKKAYAEIILNTTKEAAVRIMESERKAMRYQQELSVAKEEALHMLMRLKQMLDAKNTEAEIVSMNQQKKIDELEAQLQEAEDIVKELREDLREVQAELDRRTTSQSYACGHNCTKQCCMEHDAFCPVEASKENGVGPSESIMISLPNSRTELVAVSNMKNLNSVGTFEGTDCYPYDCASILVRLKETEVGKNKSVQRIRACDLNGVQVHEIQQSPCDRRNEEGDHITGVPKLNREKVHETGNCENGFKKRKVDKIDIHLGVAKSFRKKRKRSARLRKPKVSSFMNLYESSKTLQNRSCSDTSLDSISAPVFPSDTDKMIVQSGQCSVEQSTDNAKVFAESHLAPEDNEPEKASALTINSDKSNSSQNLDLKASDNAEEFPCQSPSGKFLKYTFQRKRKKEILSSLDQNCAVEEKDGKSRIVERSNFTQESMSQSFKSEPSRDTPGLMQVAHQLLCLSERKW